MSFRTIWNAMPRWICSKSTVSKQRRSFTKWEDVRPILFIRRKPRKIINKSLPFGIEELVENYEVPLKDNDVIIMSSDGILENVVDANRLETFLKSVKDLTPQRIVYELFNFAVKNELKTNDDMTLIALRIKEA